MKDTDNSKNRRGPKCKKHEYLKASMTKLREAFKSNEGLGNFKNIKERSKSAKANVKDLQEAGFKNEELTRAVFGLD